MRTSGIAAAAAVCTVLWTSAALAQEATPADVRLTVSVASPLEMNQAGTTDDVPRVFSPAIAGGMSAFLPGAGQFYNGQGVKGGLMITGFAASLAFAFTQGINAYYACAGTHDGTGRLNLSECGPVDHLLNYKFWLGMGAATGVYTWSVFDAISVARKRTAETRNSDRGASIDIGPMLVSGEPVLGASLRFRR